ncbi:hypothetical protein [Nonomuraea soli]|uniref:Tetratricopeptide (TPR) repeat protein n=1 Tax=Nonomuraea soli TaxID=1032476 RepID=A0A7W0CJB0_9ACTN|nr:hypothetical protein [Nonomuraea soli]MBA2892124.1 tetratricopeptide (TPR) repeat protein [Nonomuraea soli]
MQEKTPVPVTRIRTLDASAEVLALSGDYDAAVAKLDAARSTAVICPIDRALRAANAVERLEDRIRALGSVARALSRAGRHTRPILDPYIEADLSSSGLRALAEALIMAGDLDAAASVAGRDPDPSWGWDAFAHSLIRAGHLDHAQATARLLIPNRPRRNLALLLVAQELAGSQRADEARKIVEHITDPAHRSRALRHAARTAEQLDRAQVATWGITNSSTRDTELLALATAWIELGHPDRAAAAVESIASSAGRVRAAITLARLGHPAALEALPPAAAPIDPDLPAALAQAGRPDEALALANTIPSAYHRQQALIRVARAMDDGTRAPADGTRVLDDLVTAALSADGEDDIRHLYALTELALAARPDQAAALLERAESLIPTLYEEEERLEAWRLLVQALARAGLLDRADAVAARRWPSPWPDLVRTLCDLGAYDQAQDRARSIPDPGRRSWALHRIAAAHAQSGRTAEAESLARTIEEPEPRAKALLAVARARTAEGHLNLALELLDDAEAAALAAPANRDKLLSELTDSLLAVGHLPQLASLDQSIAVGHLPLPASLDQSIAAALDIPDRLEQCRALASLAEAYAGRTETIAQILLHAEAISSAPEVRLPCQARLARAWATTGDTRRATTALDDLLADPSRLPAQSLVDAAHALTTLGDADRALSLAIGARHASEIIATVALHLAKSGDSSRALELARSLPDAEMREWVVAETARELALAGDLQRALSLIRPADSADSR